LKRIGFIGLGIMGGAMSMNLLRVGFPLTVWNRTAEKMRPLLEAGAKPAKSPKEVAKGSDIVIDMVTDSKDVEEVLIGEEGVIQGARPGTMVVDMSTISPIVTREIAKKLGEKGIRMLDAPVSGGDIGARNATLSIMVGGDAEAYEECLPVFQAMGKTITYIGGHGDGQICKAVNQILVGANVLGVAEALMFASKAGVDLDKVLAAVSGGAAGSWQLANNGPKMLKGDYAPGFKVKDYIKDLRIIMETAAETKTPLVETAVVQQMFRHLDAEGLRDKGTQAVIVAVEKLAGRKLAK
jgi:3-hydroxyisobutyrate dehydrogenase